MTGGLSTQWSITGNKKEGHSDARSNMAESMMLSETSQSQKATY